MGSTRELFFKHLAQTSPFPLGLEMERAEGCYIYDTSGKKYLDLISGISVSNLGHRHPKVIQAIEDQLGKYMHLMVYGEYVQSPQVKLAELLCSMLPPALQSVYFVNSGAEAVEGAMKLAKRHTGRKGFISFKHAYHGSTQGALSLMGDERLKKPFYPLLPDVRVLDFNDAAGLALITELTAAVFIEPIQGEAGIILPEDNFLRSLASRCKETGTLLVFDEVQTGYGRTGKLFAFEHYGVVPDILCLAKGMGGGMPLGAFVSSMEIMSGLSHEPELGHISTFGGHPVCCAAGYATLQAISGENLLRNSEEKGELFIHHLKHPLIRQIRGKGLFTAVEFESFEFNKKVIDACIVKGLIVDWFLFNMKSMRIAPPLIITEAEIVGACKVIVDSINESI